MRPTPHSKKADSSSVTISVQKNSFRVVVIGLSVRVGHDTPFVEDVPRHCALQNKAAAIPEKDHLEPEKADRVSER